MRKKWILPIVMAIFTLPFFSGAVFAEETVVYEDGEHKVPFEVKHGTEDKVSAADGYLTKPAKLTVKDGSNYVQLEITSSSMIKSLTVPSGEVDLISEDLGNDTRIVGFKTDGDLSEPLVMKMHVIVPPNPYLPDGYDTTHTARAFFDVSDVPLYVEKPVEEPTEPEVVQPEPEVVQPEPEEAPVEPVEPIEPIEPVEPLEPGKIDLADGFYTIKSSFLHLEEEKASAMARHLGGSMFLEVVNGKVELTVTVNADETVTLLKVDGKNAIQSKIDGKKRYDTYKLDSLATTHHGYVDYQMGSHSSNANFRIVLDKESVEGTTASNKPGVNLPETGGDLADIEDNDKPEEKEGNDKLVDKVDVNKPADKKEAEKKNQLVPDKAYEIDFVIKHDKEDKASAANSFFKGPAILLEKDGQKYLQITVTGKEYIDWLKNKFGEMVVVKENKDSIVYQLKLDGGLSDAILLEMQITVPEIPGYDGEVHKARLFLDESSMREVDASDYSLVASSNENGPTVEGDSGENNLYSGPQNNSTKTNNNNTNNTKNDPTIEKPKFGSNETNKITNESKIFGQEKNPQTGDTTNILLYVLLLIGSAVPLAVMAKRRFTNVA